MPTLMQKRSGHGAVVTGLGGHRAPRDAGKSGDEEHIPREAQELLTPAERKDWVEDADRAARGGRARCTGRKDRQPEIHPDVEKNPRNGYHHPTRRAPRRAPISSGRFGTAHDAPEQEGLIETCRRFRLKESEDQVGTIVGQRSQMGMLEISLAPRSHSPGARDPASRADSPLMGSRHRGEAGPVHPSRRWSASNLGRVDCDAWHDPQ